MIDEKKLLEELRKQKEGHERDCELFKESEYASLTIARLVDEVEYIEKMVEEQPKVGEWIPCKERLPEKTGFYIVTKQLKGSDAKVAGSCFYHQQSGWSLAVFELKVIAWMPYPEVYEEEG